MIPILQFDPATLMLWYDTQLLATSRAGREIGLALHYAVDGREDWLKCLVRQQSDPWTRTRCATVASAVWHEKRHFLDFTLTNYGAMRMRQFFQCYVNLRLALHKIKENGPLLLPLDRNLDALRAEMMGVSIKDHDLVRLAEGIRNGKRMILDDRRPFIAGGQHYEIGGEAMFECIAYHVQLGKAHRVFGGELNAGIQRDNPKRETTASKYQWASLLLIKSGLMNVTHEGEHEGEPTLRIDDGPVIPLLYGALASRYHRQTQTRSAFVSSYHPAERLGSLIAHFNEHKTSLAGMKTAEAWDAVNAACKTVFGRTALEEIDADYHMEGELIATYKSMGSDEFAVSAYEDFHALRGRFIQVLKDDPELILDQAQWADKFVNKTRPFVVAAAPAGVIGTPPDGFERLSGGAEEGVDFAKVPEFQWWWTALRAEKDEPEDDDVFRLADRRAWSRIAVDFAPFSKLMIDGNRMRSMVGPELLFAKSRIERETGVSLIVDPLSRYPEEDFDIAQWYFLTGQDSFRCHVTHQIVQAPHGRMIGPWEFRRRPAFHTALLDYLSGDQKQRMFRALWRDWSCWLVSDEIGGLFDSAKIENDLKAWA